MPAELWEEENQGIAPPVISSFHCKLSDKINGKPATRAIVWIPDRFQARVIFHLQIQFQ